ncbi:MAG: GyrI-like domain-containing protein [Candidatus Bathyarchaeota archaeon]|nr:MAG: GyrI-like domain-containing protein [Candidatus Bathyarchaeota archaeon]
MMKIDFKRELKPLYNPSSKKVVIVDVPKMSFLMVDGAGDPNNAKEYKDAVEVLFAVSYALKFMIKKRTAMDYRVLPLEGLWWTDDMTQFSVENKDIWKWTSMIMQPEYVTEDLVGKALEQVEKKKNLSALSEIRYGSFHEGLSAQIMHIGPYSDEGPTIDKLHDFIRETGHELCGKHHEIYLSDPRRSAPEKMKTVIRQPMK